MANKAKKKDEKNVREENGSGDKWSLKSKRRK